MWTAPKSKLSKFSDFVKQTDYLGVTSVSQFDLGVSALASRPVRFLRKSSSYVMKRNGKFYTKVSTISYE